MRKSSLPEGHGLPEAQTAKALETALEAIYDPSSRDREIKVRFWQAMEDNPMVDASLVTVAMAAKMTGSRNLEALWSKPGFKSWFLNDNEFRQRVDVLSSLALDAIEAVLKSDDPKGQGARVNAAKLLLEMANKMPAKQHGSGKQASMEKVIASMDRVQLEAFMQSQAGTLHLTASKNKPETITIIPEDETK